MKKRCSHNASSTFLRVISLLIPALSPYMVLANMITDQRVVVDMFPTGSTTLYKIPMKNMQYLDIDGTMWDFSMSEDKGKGQRVDVVWTSRDTLLVCTPSCIDILSQGPSGMKLLSKESPLLKMDYIDKPVVISLNMQIGDSIVTCFNAEGTYSDHHSVPFTGRYLSRIKAIGSVITEECDTIDNIVMIENTQYLNAETSTDLSNNFFVISSSYLFYSPQISSPLYEIIRTKRDSADISLGEYLLYRYSLLDSIGNNVSIPELCKSKVSYSDKISSTMSVKNLFEEYEMSEFDGIVKIRYKVSGKVHVSMIISDKMGVVYRVCSGSHDDFDVHTLELDTKGMRRGMYVISISVNDKSQSEKLNVR